MATSSTDKRYTIQHENDSVPTELPVYPTAVSPSNNIVSRSWNDSQGVFHDILQRRKIKLNWVFDQMPEDKAVALLETLIYSKIEQYGTRFFWVNSYCPGRGWINSKFYLGTPDSIAATGGYTGKGQVGYSKAEIHWIEVEGVSLIK